MKSTVIRVGDTIKVVTSKFIKRVGYPLVWTDLIEEVENDPRTQAAWDLLKRPQLVEPKPSALSDDAKDPKLIFEALDKKLPFDFIASIARERVREMGFGGRERQLIYKETSLLKCINYVGDNYAPDMTDRELLVTSKRLAKTGTYYPPKSGTSSSYWDPEDYYEPGGLENCKTHVLLGTCYGLIEAVNVTLVKRAPGSTDKYPASSKYVAKAPRANQNRGQ